MTDKLLRRSDIDLLRAVAVLLVIFYHYFPSVIEFGYLGVDIFLVISGYLMVASYKNSKNGIHFIKKRAYRLFPGLLSVALICFVLIFMILRQDLVYGFAKEILTSVIGLSNYYYYTKVGYFDPAAENKIFLMSWTLSLELQYYLILALSFGIFFKSRTVLLIALLSYLASSYIVTEEAAFFLITSRLWEFLAGAFLFIIINDDKYINKNKIIIIVSIISIIVASVVDYSFKESSSILKQILAVIFSILVLSKIINFLFIYY